MQNKVKAWRRYYGITQIEMARELGISDRTYINKETGRSEFTAKEMFLVARVLQKKVSEIFLPPDFSDTEHV